MRYAQGIHDIMGEGEGGMYGGAKRLRRHISGKSWRKYLGNPGEGDRERGTHSRGRGGRQNGKASRDLEMLGRRRATTRWEEDPV